MNYQFPCTVTDIFERKFQKHKGGIGPAAIFSSHSAGWYIQIDGAFSIYVGDEKPSFQIDEAIVLSIKKARDA